MICYDCKDWEQGREDGTCIHYINNSCPYGYHDDEELYNDLLMEQKEQM